MIYINNFLMIWVARECPTGLRLHFYRRLFMEFRIYHVTRYQCPLGLVLHFYKEKIYVSINMGRVSMPFRAKAPFLLGKILNKGQWRIVYQCPFGLVLHFYHNISWGGRYWIICVSMPFRAGAPFLRYPFKNLGFMRFLEPVFAGIYQNILTMTIFRAC